MLRQSATVSRKSPILAKWTSPLTKSTEISTVFLLNLSPFQATKFKRVGLACVVFPIVACTSVYCTSAAANYLEYFNTWTPEDEEEDEDE